jgi:hypothetical protein
LLLRPINASNERRAEAEGAVGNASTSVSAKDSSLLIRLRIAGTQ